MAKEIDPDLSLLPSLHTVLTSSKPGTMAPPDKDTLAERVAQSAADLSSVGDRCFLCAVPWDVNADPPTFAIHEIGNAQSTPQSVRLTTDLAPMLEKFRTLSVDQERTRQGTFLLEHPLFGSSTHGIVAA